MLLPCAVIEVHLRLHLMEDPVSLTAADEQPSDDSVAEEAAVVNDDEASKSNDERS